MANPKKKFSFLDSNFFLISLVRNMYIPKHTPVQCVKQRKKYLTWYMYQVLVPQTSQDQLPVGRVTTMSQTTYTSRMVRTIFSTVFFTSFITYYDILCSSTSASSNVGLAFGSLCQHLFINSTNFTGVSTKSFSSIGGRSPAFTAVSI